MKGRISKELDRTLRDPEAAKQLRKALLAGAGEVVVEGRTYRVRTEPVPKSPKAAAAHI
ncbi:MAG TPA: hypothetical protein VF212_13585 [Longimicrobiales bacterium]